MATEDLLSDFNQSKTSTLAPSPNVKESYRELAHSVGLACLPCILLLGVIGNTLSVVVLQSRFYRQSSTGFLLTALAILDSLSLTTGLLRNWIRLLSRGLVDVRMLSKGSCVLHFFLTYASQAMASWTLVVFTIERTISVYFPIQIRHLCTRRRIITAWRITFCIIVGFYAQLLGMVELDGYMYHGEWNPGCNFKTQFRIKYDMIFSWIDLVIMAVIPWITIAICNVLIILRLYQTKRERQLLHRNRSSLDHKSHAITVMLVVVSVVFLITTLPYALYYATFALIPKETPLAKGIDILALMCINTLYFFNNAVNFLLYCLSADRFRHAFAVIFCRVKESATPENTMTTKMSCRSSSIRHSLDMNYSTVENVDNGTVETPHLRNKH